MSQYFGVPGNYNFLWVYEGEQTWTQPLPPMPTRRCAASAVVYQEYIIVAGGLHDLTDRHLDTVEVFNGLLPSA